MPVLAVSASGGVVVRGVHFGLAAFSWLLEIVIDMVEPSLSKVGVEVPSAFSSILPWFGSERFTGEECPAFDAARLKAFIRFRRSRASGLVAPAEDTVCHGTVFPSSALLYIVLPSGKLIVAELSHGLF